MSDSLNIERIAQRVAAILRERDESLRKVQALPESLVGQQRDMLDALMGERRTEPPKPVLLDDPHIIISNNDTTPGVHEDKVVDHTTVPGSKLAVKWETANDGENETRKAYVSASDLIVVGGEALVFDEWIDINGATTKDNYLFEGDLRGRKLAYYYSYYIGTEAEAIAGSWAPGAFLYIYKAGPTYAGADINMLQLAIGNWTFDMFFEASTGYIYYTVTDTGDPNSEWHLSLAMKMNKSFTGATKTPE